jgi:hypothetical protein
MRCPGNKSRRLSGCTEMSAIPVILPDCHHHQGLTELGFSTFQAESQQTANILNFSYEAQLKMTEAVVT